MARIRQVVAALAIAAVASHSLAGADAAPTSPKSQRPALSVAADGNFHDASGRAVILRGVNVATKVPDFAFLNATAPDAYKKFVDPLVDWGFNAVRLAFTLEAYYPTRGNPNAAYLASYRRMIQELGNRGIYTIVDFHQDAFSRWSLTGCGEGYPEWFVPDAVKSAPADQTSVVDLYAHACPFWGPRIGIFSDDEIKATYGQLYTPGNDIRNAFISIIQEVAGSLRDLPSVIAYDLANELPKVTNTTVDHIPLYRDLTTAIRAVNPNAVIMYEETISGPGTKEELPNPEIANSVYSSHFYDTRVNLDFWMTQFDFWLAPGSAFLAQIDAGISAGQLLPLSVDAVSAAIQALGAVVGAIQAGEGILQQYYAGVKSFLPEQVQAAVESTVPQLQAQIAATAGALAALDFSTAWSADATTALIAQVEALRSVAYPYIFDLMAPALQPILPVLDSGATDYVKSIKQTATSYGSGYVLGEFGLPPTTIFVNPTQYIDEILNGVDSSLSSSVQWMYNPLWSPVTKDGWNMEDFSIIDNTGAPRANFHIYRPYPQVTAGTPVALSVNYAQKTMTYTFNATESDNPSVFYYHINGLCGAKGKAKVTSIPSGAVKCDTSNRNGVVTCENKKCGQVTVNLSCK